MQCDRTENGIHYMYFKKIFLLSTMKKGGLTVLLLVMGVTIGKQIESPGKREQRPILWKFILRGGGGDEC